MTGNFNIHRPLLIVALCIFCSPIFSQTSVDDSKGLNDLELGQELSTLIDQLQMITGNETVYQNNPNLAEIVKNNLKKGIQEGINVGETRRIINGYRATDHRILFFKNAVYKIRWNFDKSDFPVLEPVFKDFVAYFTKKFGQPTDAFFEDTFIWKGEVNRLQLFSDGKSIQIEFRNDLIEKGLRSLGTNNIPRRNYAKLFPPEKVPW